MIMASATSTQNRPLKSTLKLIDPPPIFNKVTDEIQR